MAVPQKVTKAAAMPPAKKSAGAAVKKKTAKGSPAKSAGTAVKKTAARVGKAIPAAAKGSASPGGY